MADKPIQATLVLEILGRPAEHLTKALTDLVSRLGSEKGIKIIEKVIHEPVLVKESKEIYTSFAEVNLEFESLVNYFGIIFSYMPAHIEITSPSDFKLTNIQFNELGNRLLARLHDYDAITKRVITERNFLVDKLKQVSPELFKKPEVSEAPPAVVEEPVKKQKAKKKSKR